MLFDLGGVVLPSPFEAWAEYEAELGLPTGFIRTVVAEAGDNGAWARHERGELTFPDFVAAFESECRNAGGTAVSATEVMARLMARPDPRPEMLGAISAVRAAGLRTGALTNNWPALPEDLAEDGKAARRSEGLFGLFDAVIESSVEGVRKPDPRIYVMACERLGVEPARTVFLDDLGMNLKPARELGMTTIKVVDAASAIAELEAVLGLRLS